MTAPAKQPIRGIAIFGPNGAGKSTLAHALWKVTGFCELDAEDLYFPEQRVSRLHALEQDTVIETPHLGDLPFSVPRSKAEVEQALLEAIRQHDRFILSGVSMNWNREILSHIELAFVLRAPLHTRLERIQKREALRFGDRVLPSGDMYVQQLEFRKMVEDRDPAMIERSADRLTCPVIPLDSTQPVAQNLTVILAHLYPECPADNN